VQSEYIHFVVLCIFAPKITSVLGVAVSQLTWFFPRVKPRSPASTHHISQCVLAADALLPYFLLI